MSGVARRGMETEGTVVSAWLVSGWSSATTGELRTVEDYARVVSATRVTGSRQGE